MRVRAWHVFLILSVLFTILTLVIATVEISEYIDQDNDFETKPFSTVVLNSCLTSPFPIAVIFIIMTLFFYFRTRKMNLLGERLRSYRITKMSDLAGKMGVGEQEAKRMVERCVGGKFVEGKFDPGGKYFLSREYIDLSTDVLDGWQCPKCNRYNHNILLPGEYGKCEHWGAMWKGSEINRS